MPTENAQERNSESLFEEPTQATDPDEQEQCLACRVWWKVAIVLVLVVAVVGIVANKVANKQRDNDLPGAASAPAGVTDPLGRDQSIGAADGTEGNTFGLGTVLATVNGEEITLAELEKALAEMPEQYSAAFKNSRHELLEQLIVQELLVQEARSSAAGAAGEADEPQQAAPDAEEPNEDGLINALLRREVLEKVAVTEEDLRRTYEELKDEAPEQGSFEEVKESLQSYVRQEKQNKAVEAYIVKLREAASINRNEEWIEAQKTRAAENPLDRALATGRPVLADFGRGVCIPCKMMKPILDKLQEEYKGRAEILIIEIDEYPAVTQRVGIRAIPTQIFYDSRGEEVYRHRGFMPREAMVEKLREMGVK